MTLLIAVRVTDLILAVVSAVLVWLITWRAGGVQLYDFHGHPQRISLWQHLARYAWCAGLLYFARITVVGLQTAAPATDRTAELAFVVTLSLIGSVGWFRQTKPRPVVRPWLARRRARRHTAVPPKT